MGKTIDETGNRYGRWIVLQRAENYNNGTACWLCQCDCGIERAVIGTNLRNGHSQSCGCLQKELMGQRCLVDRIGQRYKKLVVIRQEESTDEGNARWLCQCDCGKTAIVTGHNLQLGNTKSCGCLWRESVCLPKGESALNQLIRRYQFGATERGYKWELTKEQVRVLTKQSCYYCGKKPAQIKRGKTYNGDYIYNGIDRQDNNGGYALDNVVSCCKRCNYAKSDMGFEEFRDWIRRVYEHFIS